MTDALERAQVREAQLRDDALADQARRAGLEGKTPADSAEICGICEEPIPLERRAAYPGTQLCIGCKEELERELARCTG